MLLSVSFAQKPSDRHARRSAGTKDTPGQSRGRDKDEKTDSAQLPSSLISFVSEKTSFELHVLSI